VGVGVAAPLLLPPPPPARAGAVGAGVAAPLLLPPPPPARASSMACRACSWAARDPPLAAGVDDLPSLILDDMAAPRARAHRRTLASGKERGAQTRNAAVSPHTHTHTERERKTECFVDVTYIVP
jgi:hypothetical protein